MKNKKLLIFLGLLLLMTIAILIAYAYSVSREVIAPPIEKTEIKKAESQDSLSKNNELDRIKEEIMGIEGADLNSPDCSEEEATKYEESIKTGSVKTAKGTIKELGSSSLKIDFVLDSNSWSSNVEINQDTLIMLPGATKNVAPEKIAIKDLKIGDTVLVNVSDNLKNNRSFIALSIFKIN